MSPLRYVPTEFGQIAYREDGAGDGLPLLLCQRFRGTIDDWDPAFIAPLSAHRRVIRFDSAGIGGSGGSVPPTIEAMGHVAIAFLDALQIGRADLLGWSLGGIVAQHAALQAPHRFRRVIIAGSGPGGAAEGPAPHPKVREVMAHPHNGPDDFLFLFFHDSETSKTAGRNYLRRLAGAGQTVPPVSGPGFIGQLKAIAADTGVRERLADLAMPLLVANGVHDVMIPAFRSYLIAQSAPAAKLILYPDAGHAFLFQYADEFASEINRFLSEV
jgi:pimeloyl-ACP methyl ester carboxylesterase